MPIDAMFLRRLLELEEKIWNETNLSTQHFTSSCHFGITWLERSDLVDLNTSKLVDFRVLQQPVLGFEGYASFS